MPKHTAKVLIVDDSAVFRGLWNRVLTQYPQLEVVGTAGNGEAALKMLEKESIDIVLLDVEMPIMDGMTAIPLIVSKYPQAKVILVSSHTSEGADKTVEALSLGASDFVHKPSALNPGQAVDQIASDLISKINALCGLENNTLAPADDSFTTRPFKPLGLFKPKIVAIGCSTGGPNALTKILCGLSRGKLNVPVVIVQHIPKNFAEVLAGRISKSCDLDCVVATDGMELKPGRFYLAPGDFHMFVSKEDKKLVLRLNQEAQENFCRPAVDVLFRSLPPIFGSQIVSVILTGMGEDGKRGAQAIVERGGLLIAQDKESSTVWGMPGAVAMAGLCHFVLDLNSVWKKVEEYLY